MSDSDWERQFEDSVARERGAMIDLLDASRGLTGAFRPQGSTPDDAADAFARHYATWRAAADDVTALAATKLQDR